jgi:hypothetical protein
MLEGLKFDQGSKQDVLNDGELGQNLSLVHFEEPLVDFGPGRKGTDVPQLI